LLEATATNISTLLLKKKYFVNKILSGVARDLNATSRSIFAGKIEPVTTFA